MELKEALIKRRSIRKYDTTKQISEEQLRYILFAGMSAPISHKAYKNIKITVVQDKKVLKEIADTFGNGGDPLYGVPTLIIISTKPDPVKNIEYFNVACMVQNMMLAAADKELGSIYLTAFLDKIQDNPEILQAIGAGTGYKPLSAVGVGYKLDFSEYTAEQIEKRIEIIRT